MTAIASSGWTLRRRVGQLTAGFALAIAVLVALIAIAGVRFVGAGNEVIYRWQPARLASQQLQNDLVNQETGIRGYQLTRTSAALEPYRYYLPKERADTTRLRSLIADDTALRSRVRAVLAAVQRWRSGYVDPVLAHHGRLPSRFPSSVDAGRSLFDRIRAVSVPLDHGIASRTATAQHARTVTGVLAVVAIGVGVLLVTAAGILVRRGLAASVLGPIRSLVQQTRAVAGGDLDQQIAGRGPLELVGLGADVEAMRARLVVELSRAEQIAADLRRQGAELERSNDDLQQFAYVASHDLSEPLRKVSNFCQLLERQYGPQLDDRARQYIDFAVDGAKRMQALIIDLLALSRVGRTTERFVPVDLDHVLAQALATLTDRIEQTGATVTRPAQLPTVAGDRSLLTSLFENLIGNAIKYHRDDVAPVIELDVARDEQARTWIIRVIDNGIGIDPQYAERIFAVFQRLHLRDQYGGTGIGLALCRRIVEFHGGTIRLDSAASSVGAGSTFVMSFPEGDPRGESNPESPA